MRGAVVMLVTLLALASSAAAGPHYAPLCADRSCPGRALADDTGAVIRTATPSGLGAADIQAMFDIDATRGSGTTVTVVDAYGYTELESDLAIYRAQYGLPACTVASGCLTILNNFGSSSPLDPDSDQGWITETALDVDMVSAACPLCNITVVQASSNGIGLFYAQQIAAKLDVDAISDSWSADETDDVLALDGSFDLAGVGVFAATGDDGYNGASPQYPSTSSYVIAVGGVQAGSAGPVAWPDAGSSCSQNIAKPGYEPATTTCPARAAADISALAQDVASYVALQGGWAQLSGTSAATPIATAVFAGAGHPDAGGAFVYQHIDAFTDITSGSNGSCGTAMCDAGAGWDGPTGIGIPDQQKLAAIGGVAGSGPAIAISYPTATDALQPGFGIQVAPDATAVWVDVRIDGARLGRLNAAPWTIQSNPNMATGAHTITAIAYDIDHNSQMAMVAIELDGSGSDAKSGGGGCSASGAGGGSGAAGALALALVGLARGSRRARAARGPRAAARAR